ncbi:protein HtrL [Aplysia californica]|uniref:Protein HtrL n=1 Tax=Aplysia californica TaxID=6500 RepID=A0ABM1A3J5_APLCA|nr:protein HtrL [Aplysia californica]XP_012940112.1 protein HtrL [Aplysia californica]
MHRVFRWKSVAKLGVRTPRWLMRIVLLLTSFVVVSAVYVMYSDEVLSVRDSVMAMSWQGFGPERGEYNFTVVTAMLDIGRGSWSNQRRSYNEYLLFMQRVLRLDVSMVVFVDPPGKPFIDWMRRGRENRTKIIITHIKELPYYKYRDRIAEIMDSEEYKRDNELLERRLCESYIPDYDILQLSKLHFVDRSIQENPFNTTYFMWMDGGYGHGHDIHPPDGVWTPKGLFEHSDRITLIEREPGVMQYYSVKDRIHKMSVNALVGGFHAGGSKAFQEWHRLQQQQLVEWMANGVIDDDQTMNMMTYYRKPELFRLVKGDWFDAFKLFNGHGSNR